MDYRISTATAVIIGLLAIWELGWKGFALWKAARERHLAWYVAILVVNSVGVLPIVYLLLGRKNSQVIGESHS